MNRSPLALAALFLALALPARADTTLTFETSADGVTPLTGMVNTPGLVVPAESRLSDAFLAAYGVMFSSDAGYVAVVNHTPGCLPCTPTPLNIIGGVDASGRLSYGSPITASFFSTADPALKATTNLVRVLGERFPDGSTITLEAYDVSGNLLGATSVQEGLALGTGAEVSLSLAGIHSVRIFSDKATVGYDNFQFGDLQATAAIPEPSAWALMIGGFGLVGSALRRHARPARA